MQKWRRRLSELGRLVVMLVVMLVVVVGPIAIVGLFFVALYFYFPNFPLKDIWENHYVTVLISVSILWVLFLATRRRWLRLLLIISSFTGRELSIEYYMEMGNLSFIADIEQP
jgi:hypothetical protein